MNTFKPGQIVITTLSGHLIKVTDNLPFSIDNFSGVVIGKIDSPDYTSLENYEIGFNSRGWIKRVCIPYNSLTKIKII